MNHAGMDGAHAWPGALAFVATWVTMMVAMMLPSLAPAVRSHYRTVDRSGASMRPARSTAQMTFAYCAVWALVAVALLPLGAALGHVDPVAIGAIVVSAGVAQRTAWKARHLACCRAMSVRGARTPSHATAAWRHGGRLGFHCGLSCAPAMAVLLAVGMMELRTMLVATAAITFERLASDGARAARTTGALAIGVGVLLIVRAVS